MVMSMVRHGARWRCLGKFVVLYRSHGIYFLTLVNVARVLFFICYICARLIASMFVLLSLDWIQPNIAAHIPRSWRRNYVTFCATVLQLNHRAYPEGGGEVAAILSSV